MQIHLGEDEQPEIGLIALIDCIFFLLMFFMVATSFKKNETMKAEKQLPIILPAANSSLEPGTAGATPLVIGVDKSGQFYLDNVVATSQQLHDRLQLEASANKARRIRVDGDKLARYQDIIRVLDLCQFEGLTNISMRTRD